MGLPGGQTTGMGSGDLLHPHRDNGASHWGLSSPRKVQAGAHSAEPSLGFRVNTEMHHLYGQGEESRVSQRRERRRGGLHEAALSIQPPRHRTRLWGWFSGGFSQPCRASAAVPSTGIPHSCFLPPYLTGTSGGSAPPPTHTAASCTVRLSPPPLNAGHCSHGSPQGQAEPPGVLLPLQDAHPEPDPAAAFPPPSCIPWAVLLLSPPPSPSSTLFRLPSAAGGLELDPKEPSTPPNPPQCSPT